MDSQFINYDGRSVHDMIQLLLAASGDPEAIRALQEAIATVDAKFTPVNTELARLEDDKQDVGSYALNGIGGNIKYPDGAGIGQFLSSGNWAGMTLRGNPTLGEQNPYNQEVVIYNWNTQKIIHARYNNTTSQWENKSIWTADEDTGWQNATLATGVTGTFKIRKKNGVVQCILTNVNFTPATATGDVIASISSDFYPPFDCYTAAFYVIGSAATPKTGVLRVTTSGDVTFRAEQIESGVCRTYATTTYFAT